MPAGLIVTCDQIHGVGCTLDKLSSLGSDHERHLGEWYIEIHTMYRVGVHKVMWYLGVYDIEVCIIQ